LKARDLSKNSNNGTSSNEKKPITLETPPGQQNRITFGGCGCGKNKG